LSQIWVWIMGVNLLLDQIHIYGLQFGNRYRIANHVHHFCSSANPNSKSQGFGSVASLKLRENDVFFRIKLYHVNQPVGRRTRLLDS
jgi:hypothetical protein